MSSDEKSSIKPTGATGSQGGAAPSSGAAKPSSETPSRKDRDLGVALKTVYQQTIDEAIPQDLLDLLGKLA